MNSGAGDPKKYMTSRTAHTGPASIGHIPHSRRAGKGKPARQGRQSVHHAAVRLYPFLFNSSGNTAVSARTFHSMVSSGCCLNPVPSIYADAGSCTMLSLCPVDSSTERQ